MGAFVRSLDIQFSVSHWNFSCKIAYRIWLNMRRGMAAQTHTHICCIAFDIESIVVACAKFFIGDLWRPQMNKIAFAALRFIFLGVCWMLTGFKRSLRVATNIIKCIFPCAIDPKNEAFRSLSIGLVFRIFFLNLHEELCSFRCLHLGLQIRDKNVAATKFQIKNSDDTRPKNRIGRTVNFIEKLLLRKKMRN